MTLRLLAARRTSVVLATTAALVAVPSGAWAFWAAAGLGAGSATTAALAAPTAVTASAAGTLVTIAWTPPVQSFSAASLGYEVRDNGGALVCSAPAVTDRSCSYTAGPGTRSYAVTAVYRSWTAKSAVSNQLTVAAAPAAVAAVGGSGQSATVGSAFPTLLSARVVDAGGNPVSGATVTFTAPASGASGAFAGSSSALATTDASGLATAPAFTANTTAGVYTVTAGVSGVGATADYTLTNTPAAASRLAFTLQPAITTAGATTTVRVAVQDANGNTVTGSSAQVTLTATPSVALTGNTATVLNGVAEFSVGTTIANSYTLTASSSNLTSAVSSAYTVTPAAARKLAFTQQPTNTSAGSATPTKVTVQDQYGNTVTGSSATIALTASAAAATFTGTAVKDATNGEATFSVSTTTAGNYTLSATATGLSGATSTSFAVRAAAAASVSWVQAPPATVVNGTAFSISAKVTDQYGNTVSGGTVTLTATRVTGSGGLAFSGSNATATTDLNGVASFPSLKFNLTGTFTIKAAVSASVSLTSANIAVT